MKNTLNIDTKKMVSTLIDKGYRITDGYGPLEGKTFRIGHMGELQLTDLEEMLKVLTNIVSDLKNKTV